MTETKGMRALAMDLAAFWRKKQRNIVQFTILILIMIPLIRPVGLPLPITKRPTELYGIIENLKPGTKVICAMNIVVGMMGDINPGAIAVFHHLFSKHVKMYIVGFHEDGVPVVLEPYILSQANPKNYGYVYGEDWCVLGYVAGGVVAWTTFAKEIRSAIQYDKYGNDIESLPMMQGIKSLNDFDIILHCGEYETVNIQQWADPYHKPLILTGGIGGVVPFFEPFYNSGQLKGYVGGVTMGAEYERLVGKIGRGASTTDAVAFSGLFILILVFAENINLFRSKMKVKKNGFN